MLALIIALANASLGSHVEGNSSSWGGGNSILSDHPSFQQALASYLRQADGVSPSEYADARWDS